MKDKNWFVFLILIVVIGLVLLPKEIKIDNEENLGYCKCIGIKDNSKCLGLKYNCLKINKNTPDSSSGQSNINIILAIDISSSMKGDQFIRAKRAAIDTIEILPNDVNVAVITFAEKSNILSSFENDKQKTLNSIKGLNSAMSQKETNYKGAIKKILEVFDKTDPESIRKVVLIGDGMIEKKNATNPYADMEELIRQKACIYSLGLDSGEKNENALENFADMSNRLRECGRFYSAKEQGFSVSNVANRIYHDTSSIELDLEIHSPITKNYEKRDILVNYSTNAPSVCSYTLNNGNQHKIILERFFIEPDFGKNTIKINCRRQQENNWEVSEKVNFYVEGKKSFFHEIKDFFKRERTLTPPSKDDLKDMLRQIYKNERLSVVRELRPKGKGTLVTLLIQNTKPLELSNVRINQIIPLDLAGDISQIKTSNDYNILDSDPLVLEFFSKSIMPEEIKSISYYIDKPITKDDLKRIETEIRFDSPNDIQMEKLFDIQNKTSELFGVTGQHNGLLRTGEVTLKPRYNMNDVNVYLNIPKCMAVHINDIYFKDKNYKIISEDPLIGWHFDSVRDNISIGYKTQQEIEDYCANKISVITLADEVEKKKIQKKQTTKIEYLIPIILIPVIVVLILAYMNLPVSNSAKKGPVFRYVAAVFLIILLVWLVFPKEKVTAEQRCNCFGIGYSTHCYGVPYSCKSTDSTNNIQKLSSSDLCKNPTCQNTREYMTTDPRLMNEVGIDLALLLDQSKSMKGNKLEMAKKASIKLLSQMKEYDRTSLITFDNSSVLAQPFSSDEEVIKKSIDDVRVGYSTKYVPALTRAYYNFLSKGNEFNKWMSIFISDGEPAEDPSQIYDAVRRLANEGVCINTIGYGSEITPKSKAEKTLKKMAEISNTATGCGSYFYSPSSIDTLAQVLGRLYKQVYNENPKINIDASVNSLRLTSEEEFIVKANLHSSINKLNIPGSFSINSKKYCVPKADVKLILENGQVKKTYNMVYNKEKGNYILRANNIPIGAFNATIKAKLDSVGACSYSGSYRLGELVVEKFKGFRKCSTQSCHDIAKYLFDRGEKNAIKVLITDYAFIPQNISVDKGTTVIWKNVGEKPHTVTSGVNYFTGQFHSGVLLPGETFNKTFKTINNFRYFDNLSTRMRGSAHKQEKDITFGNFKLEYKQPIDLMMVIDSSASMYGQKVENLKRAGNHLINMVYPGDRVGLIKFSDYSFIGQIFTDNRDLLKKKISSLNTGGSTRYIPALEKAHELYNEREDEKNNGEVIVFLTDGQPWDEGKPDSILNKAKELIENGICIYTIGYGDEIYPGSQAERLLQRIVKLSQKSGNCGKYNYAPARELKLVKIFGSIYHDAAGDVKGLMIEPSFEKQIILQNETLKISAKVKSTFTNNYLPGIINKTDSKLCGPPAHVEAVIKDEANNTILTKQLKYKGPTTGYYTKIERLDKGDYSVIINARSIGSNGKKCEFKGSVDQAIAVLENSSIQVNPAFVCFAIFVLSLIGYLAFRRPHNYLK
ncbi:MAG: VWA domain-containing protein [Nanobdellota archaeon]